MVIELGHKRKHKNCIFFSDSVLHKNCLARPNNTECVIGQYWTRPVRVTDDVWSLQISKLTWDELELLDLISPLSQCCGFVSALSECETILAASTEIFGEYCSTD